MSSPPSEGISAMNVFISHSADDRALAQRLATSLKEAGMKVWFDTQIKPGENIRERISEALAEADAMVMLVTKSWLASPFMSSDLEYALGHEEFKGRLFSVIADPRVHESRSEIPWILKRFPVFRFSGADPDEESVGEITRALATAA
jgi:TIR domain